MRIGPDQRRERNAASTRRAILDAARAAFSLHGFDQAGVREITRAVGVNGSLVNRYFGSKERLFAEAMQIGLGFETFGDGGMDQVARLLADFALEKPANGFDPILTLIRSAPISQAQPVLRDYLSREAVEPLARILGGKDATERASLIVAFLIGVIILRSILESEPLASTAGDDMVALLERMLAVGSVSEAGVREAG